MRHFRPFGSKLNSKLKAILSVALSTDSIILLTAFWTILKKVLTTIAPPVNQYIFYVTST